VIHARDGTADRIVRDRHLVDALGELPHGRGDKREQPFFLAREVQEQRSRSSPSGATRAPESR
jgi:hypothetical protein